MRGAFAGASLALCRAIGEVVTDLGAQYAADGLGVAEFGCGDGRVGTTAAAMACAGRLLAIDCDLPGEYERWMYAGRAGIHYVEADVTAPPTPELATDVAGMDIAVCSLPLVAMKAAGQDVDAAWRLMASVRVAVVGYTLEPFWPPAADYGTWRERRWVRNMTPASVWVWRTDGGVGYLHRAGRRDPHAARLAELCNGGADHDDSA